MWGQKRSESSCPLGRSGEIRIDVDGKHYAGAEALKNSPQVLVVTSDIPFIHKEAIEDFLDRCADLQADLYYPIISKEANEQVFPGCIRTYVTLKEGTFTGGNMVLSTPRLLSNSKALVEKVVIFRKKPWRLAPVGVFLRAEVLP